MKSTFCLSLCCFPEYLRPRALDVGDISSFMNSDSSTLSKTIKTVPTVVALSISVSERLSSPLDDGQVISMDKPDELLLHSRQLAATRPSQRSDPLLL